MSQVITDSRKLSNSNESELRHVSQPVHPSVRTSIVALNELSLNLIWEVLTK